MASSSIENSEVRKGSTGDADFTAAHQQLLEKINKISHSCAETGTLYQDLEFPVIPEESTEVQNTIANWLRPADIVEEGTPDDFEWSLFNNPSSSDVVQGRLANCWLVSIISTIAEKKFLLDRIFPTRDFNCYGVYGLRICLNGEWKDMIIDDRLPCNSMNQLSFAKAKRKQLWVPLLEKAIAKLLGGYTQLFGRTMHEGASILTGCAAESHFTSGSFLNEDTKTKFWDRLRVASSDGFLMLCHTHSKTETDFKSVKIFSGHAYSVLAIAKIGDTRLFQIRNIWGRRAWTGDWSEHSDRWNDIPEDLIPVQGKGNSAEGIFWISMEDYSRYFLSMMICIARENYHEYSVKARFYLEGDEAWEAFEFEVLDNSQVDINLQEVSRKKKDVSSARKMFPTTMAIFDQHWGLVGFTSYCDLPSATWRSQFLAQGIYRVYITNFNPLVNKDRREFIYVCHSSKKVKCRKYTERPTNIATVLLRLAIAKGTKLDTHLSDHSVELYVINRDTNGGRALAIINHNQTKTVIITTTPSTNYAGIHSTRSTSQEATEDAIPPNCSQIVQYLLTADGAVVGDFKMEYTCNWATSEQLAGNTVIQRPSLTFPNHVIHRLVPNSEFQ